MTFFAHLLVIFFLLFFFIYLLFDACELEGMKYWHKETGTSTSSTRYWQNPQASSRDVEMTAYALLSFAASNKFVEGLDVMKWVASQRNPNGGYSSTQVCLGGAECTDLLTGLYYIQKERIFYQDFS